MYYGAENLRKLQSTDNGLKYVYHNFSHTHCCNMKKIYVLFDVINLSKLIIHMSIFMKVYFLWGCSARADLSVARYFLRIGSNVYRDG